MTPSCFLSLPLTLPVTPALKRAKERGRNWKRGGGSCRGNGNTVASRATCRLSPSLSFSLSRFLSFHYETRDYDQRRRKKTTKRPAKHGRRGRKEGRDRTTQEMSNDGSRSQASLSPSLSFDHRSGGEQVPLPPSLHHSPPLCWKTGESRDEPAPLVGE